MNESSAARLTLSTVNLSADGARIVPDGGQANMPVTDAAALAVLQAFARLSPMDLVEVEAKVYLTGPRGKVAVQNVGGKLFVTRVPEQVNSATPLPPEEIIASVALDDPGTAMSAAAVEAGTLPSEAPPGANSWRRGLRSKWTLGALGVLTALMTYSTFAPEKPEGVEIIRDPAKISRLHAQFDGRYGVPAATTLVLNRGRLIGQDAALTTGARAPLFEKSYQFGLRAGSIVLLVDNGALLEPQPEGGLKYMDSVYPRQAR